MVPALTELSLCTSVSGSCSCQSLVPSAPTLVSVTVAVEIQIISTTAISVHTPTAAARDSRSDLPSVGELLRICADDSP